jgi:hypothetical protein
LVAGAYDLHVHVAPDVVPRRIDDLRLARSFADRHLAGFVLKSHYTPTAERAAVVNAAVSGARAIGSVTLNGAIGGINPLAVEVAARVGARVVWFPTVDARNQRESTATDRPGAKPPMWAELQAQLARHGVAAGPVDVVDEHGSLLPEVEATLSAISRHDMVMATGHAGRGETFALVQGAREHGIKRIIVTHPEFTSQRLSADDQRKLADMGALLERCFTTPHTGKISWGEMVANIRSVGPQHSVLSSDLGQPFNPPVEDGLPLMADELMRLGFSEAEIRLMAVDNSRRVLE